jgi:hypothetical protein
VERFGVIAAVDPVVELVAVKTSLGVLGAELLGDGVAVAVAGA